MVQFKGRYSTFNFSSSRNVLCAWGFCGNSPEMMPLPNIWKIFSNPQAAIFCAFCALNVGCLASGETLLPHAQLGAFHSFLLAFPYPP